MLFASKMSLHLTAGRVGSQRINLINTFFNKTVLFISFKYFPYIHWNILPPKTTVEVIKLMFKMFQGKEKNAVKVTIFNKIKLPLSVV